MDAMAKLLESCAGGLQQSFESVFQRVDQSLSQSAAVMRMMNDVMEAVMLQNLLLRSSYDVARGLTVAVENQSQIMLGQVTVRAQLQDTETAFFSVVLDSLHVGQVVQFQAPMQDVVGPVAGFLELQCTSPGTHQLLTKRSPFQVLSFQQGEFRAVLNGQEDAAIVGSVQVAATSDKLPLTRVRQLLKISPLQGILTADKGRYRYVSTTGSSSACELYLSIEKGAADESAYRVTVSAAGSADSADERRSRCQQMIDEMEIVE
ncbi:unnamed protein product [Hyaloperonospora brassicae]|uniref:Uncharacterized protein n=1 Tax=Hyaloperonospora brassicae TaxID=162125 RepID=A0AAV0T083_HYABA|nr:unnamed protein product [Hyaloperonospora brassicae]